MRVKSESTGVQGSTFPHHIPGLPRRWEGAGERRALGRQLELEPALASADPVPSCRQELAGEMGTVDQDGTVEAGKGRRNHENEAQNKKAVCGITQKTQTPVVPGTQMFGSVYSHCASTYYLSGHARGRDLTRTKLHSERGKTHREMCTSINI